MCGSRPSNSRARPRRRKRSRNNWRRSGDLPGHCRLVCHIEIGMTMAAEMKPLLLHDRTRRPPEWTAHLSAHQFAVFLHDVKSHAMLDLEGNAPPRNVPAACYVFDSMS